MKKKLPLLMLSLFIACATMSAQLAKTINCSPNGLASAAGTDLTNITDLTLTGSVDQRDFVTMRDLMPQLIRIDMSNVSIATVQTYPANTIPEYSFNASDKPGGQSGDRNSTLTTIILPNNLTGIEKYSFTGCNKLTNILLPQSLTMLSESAFENCDSFTEMTIPSGITSIEPGLFYSCDNLAKVTLPEGITSIGLEAFASCVLLNNIKLPSTLTNIGNNAFENCTALTSIKIPALTSTIGTSAFLDCSALAEIVNLSTTPQVIVESVFTNVNLLTCKLFVPANSLGLYQYAAIWDTFTNINQGNPTNIKSEIDNQTKVLVNNGILSITTQANICRAELINLQGIAFNKILPNNNAFVMDMKGERIALLKVLFADGNSKVIKVRN